MGLQGKEAVECRGSPLAMQRVYLSLYARAEGKRALSKIRAASSSYCNLTREMVLIEKDQCTYCGHLQQDRDIL